MSPGCWASPEHGSAARPPPRAQPRPCADPVALRPRPRRPPPGDRPLRPLSGADASSQPPGPRPRPVPAESCAASSSPLSTSQSRCSSIVAMRRSIPSPVDATVFTTGGFQPRSSRSPSAIMLRSSRTVESAPSRSALLTTKTSPISRIPALAAWMLSPMPGASRTSVVSAAAATSTSDWPTPTVSISTTSQLAASRTRSTCGVVAASPPRCPREAIDRMKTPSSVACSCMRIRSPRRAPPENGEEGSTARTPTFWPRARIAVMSADVVVDLPTPGDPVMPMTLACPAVVASSPMRAGTSGPPSSMSEISRATSRVRPARAPATRLGRSLLTSV